MRDVTCSGDSIGATPQYDAMVAGVAARPHGSLDGTIGQIAALRCLHSGFNRRTDPGVVPSQGSGRVAGAAAASTIGCPGARDCRPCPGVVAVLGTVAVLGVVVRVQGGEACSGRWACSGGSEQSCFGCVGVVMVWAARVLGGFSRTFRGRVLCPGRLPDSARCCARGSGRARRLQPAAFSAQSGFAYSEWLSRSGS